MSTKPSDAYITLPRALWSLIPKGARVRWVGKNAHHYGGIISGHIGAKGGAMRVTQGGGKSRVVSYSSIVSLESPDLVREVVLENPAAMAPWFAINPAVEPDAKMLEILKKIRMTDEAIYSTTPMIHSMKAMINAVEPFLKLSKCRAVDTSANIGGDTVVMLLAKFKSVVAIDILPLHLDILEWNARVRGVPTDRLGTRAANIVEVIDEYVDYEFALFDPPWSGKDYKKNPNKPLVYLGPEGAPVPVEHLVNKMNSLIVMVKVPHGWHWRGRIDDSRWGWIMEYVIDALAGDKVGHLYKYIILYKTKPKKMPNTRRLLDPTWRGYRGIKWK